MSEQRGSGVGIENGDGEKPGVPRRNDRRHAGVCVRPRGVLSSETKLTLPDPVLQEKTDIELLGLWAATSSLLQEGWVRVRMFVPPSRAAASRLQKKQPGNVTGICRS